MSNSMKAFHEVKKALTSAEPQYGIFTALADPLATEVAASSDLDWIVVDTEHAPADLRSMLAQLQAAEAHDCSAVVRVYDNDQALIKRVLDCGAAALMIPMVNSSADAEAAVSYMRYPPDGVRGVASGRAALWGKRSDYHREANRALTLIAQIETAEAVENVAEIAATDGVDALFIGPSDLAANLGYLDDKSNPKFITIVVDTIRAIRAAGKSAGIFATTSEQISTFVDAGATLIAIGTDAGILRNTLNEKVRHLRRS